MSLHYLLDGYNIIHQVPHLAQLSLEDARKALIQFIQRQSPQGSFRNSVTLVFDGQGGDGGWSTQPQGLNVYFTVSQSADDYIKQQVVKAKKPKCVRVVTDDRAIQYFARAQGAEVVSVNKFTHSWNDSSANPKQKKLRRPSSIKKISMQEQYKINQELEDFWLNKED